MSDRMPTRVEVALVTSRGTLRLWASPLLAAQLVLDELEA